jgi:NADH dehydrogenase FAD-containing subunit
MSDHKLVVIGGGVAGLTVIVALRKLDPDVEIVLIEPKEFFEVPWTAYRSPFDKSVAADSLFDLKPWVEAKSVTHIRSKVSKLHHEKVELENGDLIAFAACVIAVGAGSSWPALGRSGGLTGVTREDRLKIMHHEGEKLLHAESVLVVGGGLIGIELAGDLADYAKVANKHRDKELNVTLVHSGEMLGSRELTKNASAMTKKKLEKLGVKVILNDTADPVEGDPKKVRLKNWGQDLDASEIIMTVGFSPVNSSFMHEKYLNTHGWIKTDDFFRVKGAEGYWFALGDCSTLLPNSGAEVMNNGDRIAWNIKKLIDTKKEEEDLEFLKASMKKFQLGPQIYVSTIGTKTGVAQTSCCHTQFFLPSLKNSTMFLFKIKGNLDLE